MAERVILKVQDHVADVMLNRADKMNSLDLDMFHAIGAAADAIAGDPGVRAVVLHGDGENFCAGIDLSVFQDGIGKIRASMLDPVEPSPANLFQRVAYAWRELPIPVVCAVHGVAFGGGFQLAMGADLRLAAPDARFSIMESKWGLIPDMAISTTLRHIVPTDRIKELAWTSRVFGADEALELGVVTRVVDAPLEAARQLAGELATRSPDAIRGIKRLVNEAWSLSEREALALEARIQLGVMAGSNHAEAVRANLEKRAPKFED